MTDLHIEALKVLGIVLGIIFYFVGLFTKLSKTVHKILFALGLLLLITIAAWYKKISWQHCLTTDMPLFAAVALFCWRFITTRDREKYSIERLEHTEAELREASERLAKIKPTVAVFVPRSRADEETFWMEFKNHIGQELQSLDIQPLIYNLRNEYSEAEQIDDIRNFPWDSVKGAVISPAGPDVIDEILSLVQKNGSQGPKIVLHDIAPDFLASKLSVMDYAAVCIDNASGGALAAEIMWENLKRKSIQGIYNFLLVPGNKDHLHSQLRISGFSSKMQQQIPPGQCMFYHTEDGQWTYDGARRVVSGFIDHTPTNRRVSIHGIFVCNDEMAFAVEDDLDDLNLDIFHGAAIVGFDYAYFSRTTWRRKYRGQIVGTVDARVGIQAGVAAGLISDLIQNRVPANRIRVIKPERRVRNAVGIGDHR